MLRFMNTTVRARHSFYNDIRTVAERWNAEECHDDLTSLGNADPLVVPVVDRSGEDVAIGQAHCNVHPEENAIHAENPEDVREEE